MVDFLIYTIFSMLTIAAFAKVIHLSIQTGQWIDKLLNWQNRLNKWGTESGFWNEYRYRSWGGCEICFSRFIAFIGFWAYLFMMQFVFKSWIEVDNTIIFIVANLFWFIAFCSISTILNIYTITKLFGSEQG